MTPLHYQTDLWFDRLRKSLLRCRKSFNFNIFKSLIRVECNFYFFALLEKPTIRKIISVISTAIAHIKKIAGNCRYISGCIAITINELIKITPPKMVNINPNILSGF